MTNYGEVYAENVENKFNLTIFFILEDAFFIQTVQSLTDIGLIPFELQIILRRCHLCVTKGH